MWGVWQGKGVGGSVTKQLLTISGSSSSTSSSGGAAATTVLTNVAVGGLLASVTVTRGATLRLAGSNLTVAAITGRHQNPL
jgi:hypothetical protein